MHLVDGSLIPNPNFKRLYASPKLTFLSFFGIFWQNVYCFRFLNPMLTDNGEVGIYYLHRQVFCICIMLRAVRIKVSWKFLHIVKPKGFTKIYMRNFEISWNFSIAFYPDSYVFMCFEIAQVYLPSAASRVYGGHLQNEWVIKPFRKHPKSSKFVCIKSSLPCMHNLHPFYIL